MSLNPVTLHYIFTCFVDESVRVMLHCNMPFCDGTLTNGWNLNVMVLCGPSAKWPRGSAKTASSWSITKFCSVCEYYVHAECVDFAAADCKENATYCAGSEPRHVHHWREGNLPANSKCAACRRACCSTECLTGYRCEWCGTTVRSSLLSQHSHNTITSSFSEIDLSLILLL